MLRAKTQRRKTDQKKRGSKPFLHVFAFSRLCVFARNVFFFSFLIGTAQAAGKPPGYAVASAHPLATQAGMEILEQGGNAFDAAVAVSAALAVTEPYHTGIGGGGFWLLHRESDGLEVFVDGRETAPGAATRDMYLDKSGKADPKRSTVGALAPAIPGEPAALAHLAKKYGALPLARLLAPAIRIARDGFALDAKFVEALRGTVNDLSPAARELLAPGGKPLGEGALLKQPDLARTLQLIADKGADGFYKGELAKRLVEGVRGMGGIWTEADLTGYRVVERRPLTTYFRDYRVTTVPPPSAGGVALAEVLQQLEILGWPPRNPVVEKHEVIEALRRAFHDRASYLGDPDFVSIPLPELVSRQHARALAAGISDTAATPSASLPPPELGPREGNHTSHFCVLDAQGNRVAATITVNLWFGSGVIVPGTGVFLNDEMDDFSAAPEASNAFGLIGSKANAIVPGKRPLSSMTPSFVEGPRGLLIVGTPGGSRIVSMVALGVLRFTQGFDAHALVAAPRYHHQYLPDVVEFESGAFSEIEQKELARMGHALKPVARPYGVMQAIYWDPARGTLEAAADPRGVGTGEVKLRKSAEALP